MQGGRACHRSPLLQDSIIGKKAQPGAMPGGGFFCLCIPGVGSLHAKRKQRTPCALRRFPETDYPRSYYARRTVLSTRLCRNPQGIRAEIRKKNGGKIESGFPAVALFICTKIIYLLHFVYYAKFQKFNSSNPLYFFSAFLFLSRLSSCFRIFSVSPRFRFLRLPFRSPIGSPFHVLSV